MLTKFQEIESKDYPKLDREIGDVLHQVYKQQFGSTQSLASELFKIIDAALGVKKTSVEAKNYKKVLSAIQKSKLMHPTEVSALFMKANRFLSKESTKKEMAEIKKQIKEQVMVEGIKKEEDPETEEDHKGRGNSKEQHRSGSQ